MTTEEMLRRAIALLNETNERLDDMQVQLDRLSEKIAPKEPALASQAEAAKAFGVDTRTLQRRRRSWVEGVHWWKNEAGKPIYNLPLIRDGERQGFKNPAHLLECQRWVRSQSQRRKAG